MPRKTLTTRRHAKPARADPIALRLLARQEDERRRIARLLHDDLGQTLTAAVLELEYARGGGDDAVQVIDGVVAELRRLLGAARDLSLALRPALIDEEGLAAALGALASRLASLRGAEVRWSCDTGGVQVPPLIGVCAFRTAQDVLRPRAASGALLSLQVTVAGAMLQVVLRAPRIAPDAEREAAIDDRIAATGGRIARHHRSGMDTVRAEWPLPGAATVRRRRPAAGG